MSGDSREAALRRLQAGKLGVKMTIPLRNSLRSNQPHVKDLTFELHKQFVDDDYMVYVIIKRLYPTFDWQGDYWKNKILDWLKSIPRKHALNIWAEDNLPKYRSKRIIEDGRIFYI